MEISKSKKLYNFLLVLAVLLALFIRLYRFGSVPGGMNQDGAMAAVDAKALADHGTDRFGMFMPVHLTAWGFGQMSALMSYLIAPFIKLFGLNVLSARLPSLLVSLGGLAALYFFSREAFGPDRALLIFLLAAICPWHIMQSRWALDCNLFPHFLMAGMLFLLTGSLKHRRHYFMAMLMFALSMYCYGISIYTVPVFLFAACVYLICRGLLSPGRAAACACVYLVFAWPFILCMVINALGLKTVSTPFFTVPFFPGSQRSADILFFSEHPLQQLVTNLRCTFSIILQIYNGAACNEVKYFGTLYYLSVPFIFIGAVRLFRSFRNSTGSAVTVLMFFTALFDGLITASVNINRINLLFYPLLIMAGTGISYVLEKFRKLRILVPALYLAAFICFSVSYFMSYAAQISNVFMEDFGQAVTAVKSTDAEKIYITSDSQYRGYYHVSEILTLFYHDTDALYYQSDAFREKYAFHIPASPSPEDDAVYVARDYELSSFSPEDFTFRQFGRFYVVAPK